MLSPRRKGVAPMATRQQLRSISAAALIAVCLYALVGGMKGDMGLSAITAVATYEEPDSIRVVSYNIKHGEGLDGRVDLQRTAELLRSMNADLIALQEVDRYLLRSGLQDQAKALAEMLGMDYRFSPSIYLGVGEYGNAVLSRYPIVNHERVALPGILEHRSMQKATVQAGGQLVVLANTHLGLMRQEREQQMPIVYEALEGLTPPAILAGDFNMGAGHSLMGELSSRWTRLERAEAKESVVSEIDHMFVLGGRSFAGVKAVSSIASDHSALVADVFWEW
jgi:endonuclease/exonuclease/phosphatase family metal-dependent hydrolase